jgi:hypothetical protein
MTRITLTACNPPAWMRRVLPRSWPP